MQADIARMGMETPLMCALMLASYHLLQSIAPAFDAGVELIGRTTTGTTWTVADGVNTTPDLTFLQVRGVNSCNQEGP